MRKHLMWASATLALTLGAVTACGGSPAASTSTPTNSCVNASASHRAYVVVQHSVASHEFQKCVGFTGDTIDGQTLMDQSGVQYLAHKLSSGKAVCQVDNEPQQVTECFPQNQPYWALFLETKSVWAGSTTYPVLHDRATLKID